MIEEINTLINFLTAAREPKGYVIPTKKIIRAATTTGAAKNIKKMRAAFKVELEPVSGEPLTIEAMINFLKGRDNQDDK
ncbi:hypothetical protein [Desulfurobacterium atlanticum]|uniref:Uncharacterized protein n=1 Tax=Desulfurobacterium atlanticum TaxID=240169 RepID=A0A238ZJD7_9BACT|nr:hypothetical protein [Desulfurobacterium atlanticum]SNR83380.1 hypothetical protein SAMN06265340_10921 [Desulfurobacterium atlanticum]